MCRRIYRCKPALETLITVIAFAGLAFLIWDCVEVGRNDAANLVNAVFGARVLNRKMAVYLAGAAVVLGASFATPVMETARKGIFEPGLLPIEAAMIVYITVYLVDTILLYAYSAFGMPISTTATLVFSLIGASLGVSIGTHGLSIVHWDKVVTVVLAIIISIILSFMAGFLIQRVLRGAMRDRCQDRETVMLHGPWIGGLLITMLTWFMLIKGLKGIAFVKDFRSQVIDPYGTPFALLVVWAVSTLIVHIVLVATGEKGTRYLFHFLAIFGMLCMAFAFGQNDLANCASPGLSALWLWQHSGESVAVASKVPIPVWALFGCGLMMALGMTTQNAQRVTRAAVNTGSQFDRVALWAPKWCLASSRLFVRPSPGDGSLAPEPSTDEFGKKVHYDTLRASIIMAVSASVIAFASGKGLPVSTTYVAFSAVIATGWADRVYLRGDANLKVGRAIWVVSSWFIGALIAMVVSSLVAATILFAGIAGICLALAANLFVRHFIARRSAQHEIDYRQDFEERHGPQIDEA